MNTIKPRVLRTGAPLSLEAIRATAPAVFATEPHESRGDRYRYVPTIQPLQTLLDNGWGVYEVGQQRARAADRDPYTKHMLRMRKLEDFDHNAWKGEGVPEVVLINAHDGTAAYHAHAGFFRFVCSNGMMIGTHLAGFKVRHTVGPQTTEEVLKAMEATVVDKFPLMMENIETFRSTKLHIEQQVQLAQTALRLRYGDTLAPFPAHDLLTVRREQDAGDMAWNVLNRIQENVMNGGWETRSTMFARRSAVRAVERVSAVTKINAGLWDAVTDLVTA